MARPDPIQYAERLYGAIRAANFSPISFLAFGNAVKDKVPMRNMPRIAAEPFMRVVGEMLNLEEEASAKDPDLLDAELVLEPDGVPAAGPPAARIASQTLVPGVQNAPTASAEGDSPVGAADDTAAPAAGSGAEPAAETNPSAPSARRRGRQQSGIG
jgi:hypothetical protein